MAQRVFGLCCRGEKYPVNIEHPVDFSWQLEGCKKQKEVVFRLYEGDTLVGEYRRKSRLQRFTLPQNVTLKPLAVYSYEITAITDAYTFTSERAKFRAGLVHGFSSCARWIGNGSRYVSESDAVGTPAVYLYKSFSLMNAPRDAVVHLCGLGLYELHLNGKRVGDRVLEPAFSQYDKRVLVSAYEVTEYLQAGENKIEVILGDGWYNQATRDTWGFYQAGWRDMPKLLFEMHCDGHRPRRFTGLGCEKRRSGAQSENCYRQNGFDYGRRKFERRVGQYVFYVPFRFARIYVKNRFAVTYAQRQSFGNNGRRQRIPRL